MTPTPRTCGELSCDECNARTAALTAERDELRAALALGQQNCDDAYDDLRDERDQLRADCENETKWAAHYLAQSIAEKARAERAEAELAAERARLDWLESDAGVEWQWSDAARTVSRASIDVFMKEDAK